VRALSSGVDLTSIRVSLEENRDGRRMLAHEGPLPLSGLKEIREEVEKAVKGASLSPQELLWGSGRPRARASGRAGSSGPRGKYPRIAHHARRSRRCANSSRRSS